MRFTKYSTNARKFLAAGSVAAVFAISPIAAIGATSVPINEEKHINQSLLSAAVGALIKDGCGSLNARIFLALRKARDLKKYALAQGYTKAEIDAFISSKAEKKRMRGEANAYLAANGVVVGQEQTYCALGKAEMKKKSLTGQLLRSW